MNGFFILIQSDSLPFLPFNFFLSDNAPYASQEGIIFDEVYDIENQPADRRVNDVTVFSDLFILGNDLHGNDHA